jgi:oligopeptide/dipeptide ABC transporter ATP-binding protein
LKSLPSNRGTKLETIQGQPPTLSQKIEGCKFNPRCEFCVDVCKNKIPELKNVTPEHKYACFVK